MHIAVAFMEVVSASGFSAEHAHINSELTVGHIL